MQSPKTSQVERDRPGAAARQRQPDVTMEMLAERLVRLVADNRRHVGSQLFTLEDIAGELRFRRRPPDDQDQSLRRGERAASSSSTIPRRSRELKSADWFGWVCHIPRNPSEPLRLRLVVVELADALGSAQE